MLKSDASRLVLFGLVAIAGLELGISGKLAAIWQLAFTGSGAKAAASSSSSSSAAPAPSIITAPAPADPQQPIFTT